MIINHNHLFLCCDLIRISTASPARSHRAATNTEIYSALYYTLDTNK